MTRLPLCCLPLLALVLLNGATAFAQEPAHDVNALAKQTQNPIGDLVSVPLQFNFNLQPVIPFSVTSSWKLILRTIVPISSFPAADGGRSSGGGGVVVKDAGPWVLGTLLSQLWPMADAGDRPRTDLLTIQPFVNYNLSRGWALSFSPVMTANWDAASGEQWTVPLGFGITRTTVFQRPADEPRRPVLLQRRTSRRRRGAAAPVRPRPALSLGAEVAIAE